MSGNHGNAEEYVTGGVADAETGFRWTLGDRMDIRYPNTAGAEKLSVRINVVNTFNGTQRYQVLNGEGKELERSELEGPGNDPVHPVSGRGGRGFLPVFSGRSRDFGCPGKHGGQPESCHADQQY